jgi:hypothetical protein
MSRIARLVIPALALIAFGSLHAQERRSGGGGNGLPPYNVAKERHVTGEVTGTGTTEMQDGSSMAVLNLKVDGGAFHVLLGPAGWVKAQGITFATGTSVVATGMADGLKVMGEPAMIVREIKAGTKTVALRDATGTPAWEK